MCHEETTEHVAVITDAILNRAARVEENARVLHPAARQDEESRSNSESRLVPGDDFQGVDARARAGGNKLFRVCRQYRVDIARFQKLLPIFCAEARRWAVADRKQAQIAKVA